jgi:hypothetical protein
MIYVLNIAKPYLGDFISTPSDWTPLKNRKVYFKETRRTITTAMCGSSATSCSFRDGGHEIEHRSILRIRGLEGPCRHPDIPHRHPGAMRWRTISFP